MLLNCLAQPTVLIKSKTCWNYDELKKAPLLLCHKNGMQGKLLPPGWSGKMLATKEVLEEIEKMGYKLKTSSTQALSPNEAFNINIINDEEVQYKSKNIEVTAIPWDQDYTIFLIKDDCVLNLLTDMITEDMTVFVQNKILRNSIKNGIDVLYVNDGVYHASTDLNMYPSECLLGALVTIVRPRFVNGLLNEEQLPQHIVDCCANLCDG